jgi:ribosomal protein L11 methyltransferase
VKSWPAIDVFGADDPDRLLADADEFGPSALEPLDDRQRLFFPTAAAREAAHSALSTRYEVHTVDVPDENWAQRSQDNLSAVTMGRVTIAPPWSAKAPESTSGATPLVETDGARAITVVIQPSMGFGTGHHATTRLCIRALQCLDVKERFVLDVGTGSGVLALAARALGASRALGIDNDEDAIQSANENLELNPHLDGVQFVVSDAQATSLPSADIVTANLTGAALTRMATQLLLAVRPGGALVVSGVMSEERDDVVRAFAGVTVEWEAQEDNWVGITLRRTEPARQV